MENMSWLSWLLLLVLIIFGIQGFRKGMMRAVISMISLITVILVTSWLTPHIGTYIRDNTNWEEEIEKRCEEVWFSELDKNIEIPVSSQMSYIDELPLPQSMKDKITENNNSEIYYQLSVNSFAEYLSKYIAVGIVNGIAFLIAFLVTIAVMKLILYVVDVLTELPVIGLLNRIGGFAVGIIQGVFWIWVGFIVIVLLCDTQIGRFLMETIESDSLLLWFYNKNGFMNVIMQVLV